MIIKITFNTENAVFDEFKEGISETIETCKEKILKAELKGKSYHEIKIKDVNGNNIGLIEFSNNGKELTE